MVCVEANTREMHDFSSECQFLLHLFPRCFQFGGRRDYVHDKETLRVPQKTVKVISNSYEGFKCSIKSEGEKGQMFDVKTAVR